VPEALLGSLPEALLGSLPEALWGSLPGSLALHNLLLEEPPLLEGPIG